LPANRELEGYEIKCPNWWTLDLGEVHRYRELFLFLAWRDIKVKYKHTVLGFAWAILQPLALMIMFSLVFRNRFSMDTEGIPYPVFTYSGLMFWGLFASGVNNAAASMIDNSNIIRKVYFPRILIPTSAMIVALFDFCMTSLIFLPLVFYFGIRIKIVSMLLYFPPAVMLTVTSALGLGLLFAASAVKYRDFRYIIPFSLQLLFFMTPVIYPVNGFESTTFKMLLGLNPLTGALNLVHGSLLGEAVDWQSVVSGSVSSAMTLLIGLFYFKKTEIYSADLL